MHNKICIKKNLLVVVFLILLVVGYLILSNRFLGMRASLSSFAKIIKSPSITPVLKKINKTSDTISKSKCSPVTLMVGHCLAGTFPITGTVANGACMEGGMTYATLLTDHYLTQEEKEKCGDNTMIGCALELEKKPCAVAIWALQGNNFPIYLEKVVTIIKEKNPNTKIYLFGDPNINPDDPTSIEYQKEHYQLKTLEGVTVVSTYSVIKTLHNIGLPEDLPIMNDLYITIYTQTSFPNCPALADYHISYFSKAFSNAFKKATTHQGEVVLYDLDDAKKDGLNWYSPPICPIF